MIVVLLTSESTKDEYLRYFGIKVNCPVALPPYFIMIIYYYIYVTGSAKTSLMDQIIIWRYDLK